MSLYKLSKSVNSNKLVFPGHFKNSNYLCDKNNLETIGVGNRIGIAKDSTLFILRVERKESLVPHYNKIGDGNFIRNSSYFYDKYNGIYAFRDFNITDNTVYNIMHDIMYSKRY